MTKHIAQAFVVACMDFRFQKYLHEWLATQMQDKTYDFVGYAGSTKSLDVIMSQLDISKRLHEIKEVVLIHHEDCGAYGAESTPERHATDLHKAKDVILKKYPDLQIRTLYLHLDGTFEQVV